MELILCRVAASSYWPTHNIVPHTSLHDQPYHKTMKKYEDFEVMVISLFSPLKFAIRTWFCYCPQYLCLFRIVVECRLCSSGSSRLTPSGFEAHPGANTFPPTTHCWPRDRALLWAHPLPATHFQCPRSRTATLG